MSQLTSRVQTVYVAHVYDCDNNFVDESRDCDTPEEAIEEGALMVSEAVKASDEYHYAIIQTRIIPVYE